MFSKCKQPHGWVYAILAFVHLYLHKETILSSGLTYPASTSFPLRHPLLSRLQWRSYMEEQEDEGGGSSCTLLGPVALMQPQSEPTKIRASPQRRPTKETLTESPADRLFQPERKPKIVVLGATGKIGRRVVRQLLEELSNVDATIVACCRDYDKACRVLYDDLLVLASVSSHSRKRNHHRGPRLQIVQLDLVPREAMPGHFQNEIKAEKKKDEGEEEVEKEWLNRASSAAKFYQKHIDQFDNRHDQHNMEFSSSDHDEVLQNAIQGCTAIVSCVGAVRPTNLWTDVLSRPVWRLLCHDVSSWCNDKRHPYYVHYLSTLKVVELAECEQIKREEVTAAAETATDMTFHSLHKSQETEKKQEEEVPKISRIRFVRISDLCVSQQPWALVPWIVNLFHSLVFRYQYMAELLLQSSSVLDTVILRPGDLIDEIRDENTTAIQVGTDGKVPSPSRVGRDDVAALAVAASLFDSVESEQQVHASPFHYTFGVRWVGEDMTPYPSQGVKSDGFANARLALQSSLRSLRNRNQYRRRWRKKRRILQNDYHDSIHRESAAAPTTTATTMRIPSARNRFVFIRERASIVKPYGLCVAIPLYLSLGMLSRKCIQSVLLLMPMAVKDSVSRWMAIAVSSITHLLQGQISPFLAHLRISQGVGNYIHF